MMEALSSLERSFYEIGDNDLKELWESSDFEPTMPELNVTNDDWTCAFLEQQTPVLHDKFMTEAVQSEHSYSQMTSSDSSLSSPLSDFDMDTDCFPTMPMSVDANIIKREPSSPGPVISPRCTPTSQLTLLQQQQFQQYHVPSAKVNKFDSLEDDVSSANQSRAFAHPKATFIKSEPSCHGGFGFPPTPPSSTHSDSEGSLSPSHPSYPQSPPLLNYVQQQSQHNSSHNTGSGNSSSKRQNSNSLLVKSLSCRQQVHQQSSAPYCMTSQTANSALAGSSLISSQPKGATGVLMLTEEEKRTLLAEGYPIPTRLPLTKAEEKSLKKIRRKIKNKISAQESRRKKKEYMDALEKRVEGLIHENTEYKRKCDTLENSNRSLMSQLHRLQSTISETKAVTKSTAYTQTATCLLSLRSSSAKEACSDSGESRR